MRVAIRRLRALLVLYKPCLEQRMFSGFATDLRRIGSVFGEARNWDIFCTETLPAARLRPEFFSWYRPLNEAATVRRRASHIAFEEECQSAAFTELVLGLASWAEDSRDKPECLDAEKLKHPFIKLAPKWLDKLADKVDRRGADISEHTNEELHALRRSLKTLRYGLEFNKSLFPEKKVRNFQNQCKTLQDMLGSINDAVTSIKLAQTLPGDALAALGPAVTALTHDLEQRRYNGLVKVKEEWKAFQRTRRFWR